MKVKDLIQCMTTYRSDFLDMETNIKHVKFGKPEGGGGGYLFTLESEEESNLRDEIEEHVTAELKQKLVNYIEDEL